MGGMVDLSSGTQSLAQISREYLQKSLYFLRRIHKRIENRFNDWQFSLIWKAYVSPRQWVRHWLLPVAQTIQRVGKLYFKRGDNSVIILTGEAAVTKEPLQIAYLGRKKSLNYFAFSLFGNEPFERKEIGKIPLRTLKKTAQKLARQADMVIIERNDLLKWKPTWGDWIETPSTVRHLFKIEPGEPWASIEDRFREQKRYIHKAQKENFTLATSHKKEDLLFFYDQMLVPLAKNKYDDRAQIAGVKYYLELFSKGFITFVVAPDGQRVAGSLNIVDGDIYLGMVLGVLNGNDAWVQKGVTSLLYLSDLQYCHQHGLRRIDVGPSLPFANAGLFRYKSMWGYRPAPDPWNYLNWLIWLPKQSPATTSWLGRHQFLTEFCRFSSTEVANISRAV